MSKNPIDMFVLDVLSIDIEAVEHVLEILNSDSELGWRDQHPTAFTRDEVLATLFRGIKKGNIEACVYSEQDKALVGAGERVIPDVPIHDIWFRLTRRGRTVLDSWDAPPLPGKGTRPP